MLFLCWFLILGGSEARVFLGTGGTWTEALGWTSLREDALQLNGAPASFRLWSAPGPSDQILRRLEAAEQRKGAQVVVHRGSGLSVGIALEGKRIRRYLVFSPASPREVLISCLEQTRADFLAAGQPSDRTAIDALGSLQLPPGGEIARGQTGARRIHLPMPARAAADRMDRALQTDGWAPAPLGRSSGGMRMYFRGEWICLLQVEESGSSSGTSVTLFVKPVQSKAPSL